MVSFTKYGDNYNVPQIEIYGKSTDEKPVKDETGMAIPNGSLFVEMDTSTVYAFDAEEKVWIKM